MGHYCNKCGTKLVGGVVPTACDCVECFCDGCWSHLFGDTLVPINYEVYVKNGENYEKVTTYLYHRVKSDVRCRECGVLWLRDEYRSY